jgi:hypothetical protein
MRAKSILLSVAIVTTLVPAGARAAAPAHFNPRAMPVAFDGAPWYMEFAPSPDGATRNGVEGTPVSDFGSHFGVKANLWNDRPMYLANYSTVPGLATKLDRSVFDVLDGNGHVVALKRSVHFEPWGWTETSSASGVTVTGVVVTVATDAFMMSLHLRSGKPVQLRFRVYADSNSNAINESSNPAAPTAASATLLGNTLTVTNLLGDQTFHGALTSGTLLYREYSLGFPVARTSFSPGLQTYSFDVVSAPISGERSITTAIGVGDTQSEARARTGKARGLLAEGPGAALRHVENDWHAFFDALPPLPRGSDAQRQTLYRLANAALRMNLFAPRARMPGWGAVPSKAHFNLFYGWDTPLQAIQYAEWGRWHPAWIDQSRYSLGEQTLLLQLASQLPGGQICIANDDSLTCPLPFTQPPLQAWSAWEVARRDPDHARAKRFLAAAYPSLVRYYNYWFVQRDIDLDGLPEFRFGLEYGWDDTPRYTGSDHPESQAFAPVKPVEPVDLASDLAQMAGALARISTEIGAHGDTQHWRNESVAMSHRIETKMWDNARGAWMDRRGASVATPAMWWPVFTGASTDPQHEHRVVQQHLLDPKAFFGKYPIPSVAYNDPLYDTAEGGFYWQGEIWWVPAYASLVALWRTGHPEAARVLLDRLVAMMANAGGGIFENYDALTGEVGWGALGGAGVEPSAFQFGWSSALLSQALLGRYQDVMSALP